MYNYLRKYICWPCITLSESTLPSVTRKPLVCNSLQIFCHILVQSRKTSLFVFGHPATTLIKLIMINPAKMVLVSAESERHPHTKHPPCIRTEISIDGVNIRLQGEYYCCSNNLSYGIMVHDVSIKRGLIHSLNGQPAIPTILHALTFQSGNILCIGRAGLSVFPSLILSLYSPPICDSRGILINTSIRRGKPRCGGTQRKGADKSRLRNREATIESRHIISRARRMHD